MNEGNVEISYRDIECAPAIGAEQGLLMVLRRNGAPVEGIISLKADTEFYWWTREDTQNMTIKFTWKRKPKGMR